MSTDKELAFISHLLTSEQLSLLARKSAVKSSGTWFTSGAYLHFVTSMCVTCQGGRSCAKGLRRKVLTRTKILSRNIRYFAFGGQKQCFLGKKYKVYIAYYRQLDLQNIYAQKRRICRENSKYAIDENVCPRRKDTNFCHPAMHCLESTNMAIKNPKTLNWLVLPLLSFAMQSKL